MTNREKLNLLENFITEQRREKIDSVLRHRIKNSVLVLENIYDPHNISAVIRSCDGLGFQELYIVDPNKKIRFSSPITTGAEKWINLHTYSNIQECYDELKNRGFTIYASVLDKTADDLTNIKDIVNKKTAFVLGNEHAGLSQEAINGADKLFYISMFGFVQSFNISVTAGMVLFYLRTLYNSAGIEGELTDEEVENTKISWLTRDLGIKI